LAAVIAVELLLEVLARLSGHEITEGIRAIVRSAAVEQSIKGCERRLQKEAAAWRCAMIE